MPTKTVFSGTFELEGCVFVEINDQAVGTIDSYSSNTKAYGAERGDVTFFYGPESNSQRDWIHAGSLLAMKTKIIERADEIAARVMQPDEPSDEDVEV
jgi:hypothetical protein